ncbi:iron chaperone [Mucilaginibacter ginkgonis]|uniref:DUF1801 domain-containing protein n=1 Tax=Mucilaginibacter ginkgonis TaxID=2682091 RepID=A0A6I4IMU8_9SPHI|nr:DUF1801 domain-containing protein [Mucilaginibacter ginkgonis]QQL51074.1 DUF1801 domain-containing protein [Mucilaginibacter ginkgonis]
MSQQTVIDQYTANAPLQFQDALKNICQVIRETVPGADESITYQIPTFKVDGKAVGGFGFFSKHCTYFPFSGSLLANFKTELAGYSQTKSGVHFTPDKPIPDELVKQLVKAKLLFNAKQE